MTLDSLSAVEHELQFNVFADFHENAAFQRLKRY